MPPLASNATSHFLTSCTYSKPFTLFIIMSINHFSDLNIDNDTKLPSSSSAKTHCRYEHSFLCTKVLNRIKTLVEMHLAAARTIALFTRAIIFGNLFFD